MLEEVETGVNEAELIYLRATSERGFQLQHFRAREIPWAMNLVVLHCTGLRKLREIRAPKVRFTTYIDDNSSELEDPKRSGPIPGGVLERIVAREMMSPQDDVRPLCTNTRKRKRESDISANERKGIFVVRKTGVTVWRDFTAMARVHQRNEKRRKIESTGEVDSFKAAFSDWSTITISIQTPMQKHFGFLNLPGELRNRIYSLAFGSPGPIHPHPSPFSRWIWENNFRALDSKKPLRSPLALLQVNKQISKEAAGIFYGDTPFVFFQPLQSMMFLERIDPVRRLHISDFTLWYKYSYEQTKMDVFEFAVLHMSRLPKSKKLTLCLYGPLTNSNRHLPDEHRLALMSAGGVEVKFHCPQADYLEWRWIKKIYRRVAETGVTAQGLDLHFDLGIGRWPVLP